MQHLLGTNCAQLHNDTDVYIMTNLTVSNKHSFYTTALKVMQYDIVNKNVTHKMQDMNHYIHLFL